MDRNPAQPVVPAMANSQKLHEEWLLKDPALSPSRTRFQLWYVYDPRKINPVDRSRQRRAGSVVASACVVQVNHPTTHCHLSPPVLCARCVRGARACKRRGMRHGVAAVRGRRQRSHHDSIAHQPQNQPLIVQERQRDRLTASPPLMMLPLPCHRIGRWQGRAERKAGAGAAVRVRGVCVCMAVKGWQKGARQVCCVQAGKAEKAKCRQAGMCVGKG